MERLRCLWKLLRRLSGDDAYELYLIHFVEHHRQEIGAEASEPMTKAEFYQQWLERKWNGVKRCC